MFRKSVIFAIWPSVMLGLMEKFEFLKISGELQTAGRRGRLPRREAFVLYAKQCDEINRTSERYANVECANYCISSRGILGIQSLYSTASTRCP